MRNNRKRNFNYTTIADRNSFSKWRNKKKLCSSKSLEGKQQQRQERTTPRVPLRTIFESYKKRGQRNRNGGSRHLFSEGMGFVSTVKTKCHVRLLHSKVCERGREKALEKQLKNKQKLWHTILSLKIKGTCVAVSHSAPLPTQEKQSSFC